MCDLWENGNNPCRDTTELFFSEEKPKRIELKIKTEHIDDEETGQIRDKQIFPDQTKAEVKVEEGEAGTDEMYGDWKIKNEELDIKEDESETSESRLQIHQPCHHRVGHKLPNITNVLVLFWPRNFDKQRLRKDPAKVNKCDHCDFQTKYKYNLHKHLLLHKDPGEVIMFKCSQCAYQAKRKRNLDSHFLRHKDPGEVNMFKCTQCAYQTKFKGHLNSHFLRHKDPGEVNMFKCTECAYQTKFKGHLKSHFLRHKAPGEVNMFKCSQCFYQSQLKSSLNRHLLRHKNPVEVDVL